MYTRTYIYLSNAHTYIHPPITCTHIRTSTYHMHTHTYIYLSNAHIHTSSQCVYSWQMLSTRKPKCLSS